MGFGDILKSRREAAVVEDSIASKEELASEEVTAEQLANVHIDDVEVNEKGKLVLKNLGKLVLKNPGKPHVSVKELDRLNLNENRK